MPGHRAWHKEVAGGLVSRSGQPIQLRRLSFDLLVALVRRYPRVVSNDELLESLWPGSFIAEENLKQRVRLLRRALNDNAQEPHYVATVRGWGYRLVARVEPLEGPVPAFPAADSSPPVRFQLRAAVAAFVSLGAAAGLFLVIRGFWGPPAAPVYDLAVISPAELEGDVAFEEALAGWRQQVGKLLENVRLMPAPEVRSLVEREPPRRVLEELMAHSRHVLHLTREERDATTALVGKMTTDLAAAHAAEAPDVTYNTAQDEYLIVWEEDFFSGSNIFSDIFGARISGAGVKQGSDFRLSDQSHTTKEDPSVSTDGQALYFISWLQKKVGVNSVDYDVFLTHAWSYAPYYEPATNLNLSVSSDTWCDCYPDVVGTGDGEFAVVLFQQSDYLQLHYGDKIQRIRGGVYQAGMGTIRWFESPESIFDYGGTREVGKPVIATSASETLVVYPAEVSSTSSLMEVYATPEPIFKDGFESGGTGRWSSSSP